MRHHLRQLRGGESGLCVPHMTDIHSVFAIFHVIPAVQRCRHGPRDRRIKHAENKIILVLKSKKTSLINLNYAKKQEEMLRKMSRIVLAEKVWQL